jgi:hypothetical protein
MTNIQRGSGLDRRSIGTTRRLQKLAEGVPMLSLFDLELLLGVALVINAVGRIGKDEIGGVMIHQAPDLALDRGIALAS